MRDELQQLAHKALELNKQPDSKEIGALLWQLLVRVDIVLEYANQPKPDDFLAIAEKKLKTYDSECRSAKVMPKRTSRKKNTETLKVSVTLNR